jgi:hypothetical protein
MLCSVNLNGKIVSCQIVVSLDEMTLIVPAAQLSFVSVHALLPHFRRKLMIRPEKGPKLQSYFLFAARAPVRM